MRPEKYGSHLDLIRKMGFETINLARLHDVITVKDKHTFPAIVITLNDCTLDNWVYAVPELFRQDMQGVFFAITNFLRHSRPRPRADQSGNIPIPRFDEIMNQTLQGNCECFMNHRELRALVHDLGMEVYSHSAAHQACFTAKKPIGTLGEAKHWSHKSLCGPNAKHDTPVYPAGSAYAHAGFGLDWNGRPLRIRDRKERLSLCEEGFRRAKNELETALDRPCPFICPPWGQFGTTTLAASVRAGYQPTLTLERTVVSPGSPRIGRITVKDAKNPTWLRNKLILHAHALPVKLFCSH